VTGKKTKWTDMAAISIQLVPYIRGNGRMGPCRDRERWSMLTGRVMKGSGAVIRCTGRVCMLMLMRLLGREYSLTAVTKVRFKRN